MSFADFKAEFFKQVSNFISMFHEPDSDGIWSMTRVIALSFAACVCFAIVIMAIRGNMHDVGWPFAVIVSVVVLAVPLQAFFKTLGEWFKTAPAKKLVNSLITKAAGAELGIAIPTSVSATVKTGEATGDGA